MENDQARRQRPAGHRAARLQGKDQLALPRIALRRGRKTLEKTPATIKLVVCGSEFSRNMASIK